MATLPGRQPKGKRACPGVGGTPAPLAAGVVGARAGAAPGAGSPCSDAAAAGCAADRSGSLWLLELALRDPQGERGGAFQPSPPAPPSAGPRCAACAALALRVRAPCRIPCFATTSAAAAAPRAGCSGAGKLPSESCCGAEPATGAAAAEGLHAERWAAAGWAGLGRPGFCAALLACPCAALPAAPASSSPALALPDL